MSELKTNKIATNDANNVAVDDSLNLKSYTTPQRDALTSSAGDTIFNTTTAKVEYYNGSEWIATGPATLDGDLTYLGTYDYTSSTISGGITITTTDNGGYLDVANYSRFKIFITQAKNSGPHDMNFVWNARNANNSGNLSGSTNYTGTTYQTRGNNTNTINHGDQTQHYHVLTATVMDANNDSQATVMLDVYNLGNNGLMPSALPTSNYRGTNNVIGFDFGGVWYETQSEVGAVKIVGYTTSTWNFYVDIYGVK